MKTVFKIAALAASIGLSMNVMAADDASQVFKWVGNVDPAPISGNTKIINSSQVPFDGAKVMYNLDESGAITLQSAEDITFTVVTDGGTGYQPAGQFDYELTSLSYQSAGFAKEVDENSPEFIIEANGSALVKHTAVTGAKGDVALSLTAPGDLSPILAVGQSAVVSAQILVTNVAI